MLLLVLAAIFSFVHSFCNTIKAKALCGHGADPLENGCCAETGECPQWCQTRHLIVNAAHIHGNWPNGTKYSRQCDCRFCLGTREAVVHKYALSTRLVLAHNFFRCLHDFPPLEHWDFVLTQMEKEANEHCILKHTPVFSDPNVIAGENKAVGTAIPEFGVAMWYMELKNVDPATYKTSNGEPIGHFTSMMWKKTKDIGCAMCYHDVETQWSKDKPHMPDMSQYVWTCRYANPPPNDKLTVKENLPDVSSGKNKRTVDTCCKMVYPDIYDDENSSDLQLHENPDFMWMDFDGVHPLTVSHTHDRNLENDRLWEEYKEAVRLAKIEDGENLISL